MKEDDFSITAGLEPINKACSRLGIKPTDRILSVSIGTQTLRYFQSGHLKRAFVISTSRREPSEIKGSLGTPRGLHEIAERIGAGQPPGVVFRSRVPTGRHFREIADSGPDGNLVTSRILWLRGLEPGVNRGGDVDTYGRYIYIHGTNHEERLGSPFSAGCVLMRNDEIVALFEEVRAGDLVWIGE